MRRQRHLKIVNNYSRLVKRSFGWLTLCWISIFNLVSKGNKNEIQILQNLIKFKIKIKNFD